MSDPTQVEYERLERRASRYLLAGQQAELGRQQALRGWEKASSIISSLLLIPEEVEALKSFESDDLDFRWGYQQAVEDIRAAMEAL